MDIISIVALAALGFVGLIVLTVAAKLFVVIALGAAIYGWIQIANGNADGLSLILAVGGTICFIGSCFLFTSGNERDD